MKILLVEDDEAMIALLTRSLSAHHFVVDVARDGEVGWTYGSTFEYDLIVLDVLLPKLNGIRLCQALRAEGYTTPILMLTAQNSSSTKVKGLEAGADDYVVKPFDGAELVARIRALLRRGKPTPSPVLTWGALCLNPSTCEVTYNGKPFTLTTKEYDLLELLLRDRQHVFSIDEILDRLWSSEEFPAEATVRSHIRRLRQTLTTVGAPPDLISTLHGRGYYLKPQPDTPLPVPTPPTPPPFPTPPTPDRRQQQAQYLAFLNQTWSTTRPQCLDRLHLLQQAVAAAQSGWLPPSQQQQAQLSAHQLAGTLGVFGLTDAMQRVRQIEFWLNQRAPSPQRSAEMATLLHNLQQELHQITVISTLPLPCPAQEVAANAKLLIVDDDQSWLQTLPGLLQPWGFQVTTLADPEQFWHVLSATNPDLLVLDVKLPQINGFELCQGLRSHPHWQRLPVIFLSGLSDRQIQNYAFAIGADDYLCKPIAGAELANRLVSRLQRVRTLY